jgi:hypothetical protein
MKFLKISLIVLAAFIFSGQLIHANLVSEIVYEGRLLGQNGKPLLSEHDFRFSFWSSPDFTNQDLTANGDISELAANFGGWQEVHSVRANADGTFTINLGSLNEIEGFDFFKYQYLQVEVKSSEEPNTAYQLIDVNGDGGLDQNDRQLVGTAPLAENALNAKKSYEDSFIIDADDSILDAGNGSIQLVFGTDLNKFLEYDFDNGYFNFNDNVNIEGNLTVNGLINGVDLSSFGPREKTEVLAYRFPSMTIEKDGQNNQGTLREGRDLDNHLNYISMSSKEDELNDFDVYVHWFVPNDFVSWQAQPFEVLFKTQTAAAADNKIDFYVLDTDNQPINLLGSSDLSALDWSAQPIFFSDENFVFEKGKPVTFIFKMNSRLDNLAYLSQLKLNYITNSL